MATDQEFETRTLQTLATLLKRVSEEADSPRLASLPKKRVALRCLERKIEDSLETAQRLRTYGGY